MTHPNTKKLQNVGGFHYGEMAACSYNALVTVVNSFKNFSPCYFNIKWQGQFQLKDIPSSFPFSKKILSDILLKLC